MPPPSLSTLESNAGSSKDDHDHQNDENALEPAAKDLEEAVTAYLRRATETFDLSKNVEVRMHIIQKGLSINHVVKILGILDPFVVTFTK